MWCKRLFVSNGTHTHRECADDDDDDDDGIDCARDIKIFSKMQEKSMKISMKCENFFVKYQLKSQRIDNSHENYFYLMGLCKLPQMKIKKRLVPLGMTAGKNGCS